MEGICMNFLDQVQFFQLLKGRCHGNQFCVVSKAQTTCDFCNFYTIWKRFGCKWQIWIFFDISRDVVMATNFVSYRTCLLGAEVSQDLGLTLDFHNLCTQMINPLFFFRYLKGHCYVYWLKSKNWRFLRTILFCRAAIRNGIAISQLRFHKIRYNEYLYIVYNFGDIWSRNLRVYAVNNSTFCGDTAKIGISRQISQIVLDVPWLILQIW